MLSAALAAAVARRWIGASRSRTPPADVDALLARASALLASSLDHEATLSAVAKLVVPTLAECCIIDMVEEHGRLTRLRIVHADPERGRRARAVEAEGEAGPHLLERVLDMRTVVFAPRISRKDLQRLAPTPHHRHLLEVLEARSIIQVPMLVRDRLLGAIVLVSSAAARPFDEDDLRVAQRLAQAAAFAVDNARLYAAARNAIREREELLSLVAHDLRNPLNTLVSAVSLLLRRPIPEADRRKLTLALRAGHRMDRLIGDLLDIARMEAGRFSVHPAREAPDALLEEAAEAARSAAKGSGVAVAVEPAPPLPPVLADEDRILAVFENLVGNSLKFTGAGGRITLGARRHGADAVELWVTDTGSGIPPEHLTRVFDRFWQVTRSDRRGTGLGLAICRGIVEAHGGRIWAESEVGRGTTVAFTLPAAP